jgi:hypothetical protein
LRHGPPALIVIRRFSGAGELFMGQNALVRESRSGWWTGPIFAAFAEHFCVWWTVYRSQIGVALCAEAVLLVDNAQPQCRSGGA